MDSKQSPPAETEAELQLDYQQFIAGLKTVAEDPMEAPKRRTGALMYLNLDRMGNGEKRIEHSMAAGLKARIRHGKIIVNGAEKHAVEKAVDSILKEKDSREALQEAMNPDDASQAADITRREWGGKVSKMMGWAMLVTITGKGLLDHGMNATTAKIRKEVQLPQLVKYIQDHPPPEKQPERDEYYNELDKQMSRGIVGTVRDQFPWLSIMSAVGATVLIHFGGKSREAAVQAREEHQKLCARYAADVAGEVIEKLALQERAAVGRPKN